MHVFQAGQGRGVRTCERIKTLCFKVLVAEAGLKTRMVGSRQWSRDTQELCLIWSRVSVRKAACQAVTVTR